MQFLKNDIELILVSLRSPLRHRLVALMAELTSANAHLDQLRSEKSRTRTSRAEATGKLQAVAFRFGPVSELMMDLRNRQSSLPLMPFSNFRIVQTQLTMLVYLLTTCPASELAERQAMVLAFINAQRSLGVNAHTCWELCKEAYVMYMIQPELREELRRLNTLFETLQARIEEQQNFVDRLCDEMKSVTRQLAILS